MGSGFIRRHEALETAVALHHESLINESSHPTPCTMLLHKRLETFDIHLLAILTLCAEQVQYCSSCCAAKSDHQQCNTPSYYALETLPSSKSEAHGTLCLPLASAIVFRSIQITNNCELCLVLITQANESFSHMGRAWLVTPHPCSSVGVFPFDSLSASITSVN